MTKRALLLVNTGTPDEPRKKAVRRYLIQFLNDRRVIDIPWLMQKIVVNLVIIPFRVKKSTELYKKLWTTNGSPLRFYLKSLVNKLQENLGNQYRVYGAMRYGNPSLTGELRRIRLHGMEEITILPLFPQYASSTSGSVIARAFRELGTWQAIPSTRFIAQFYNHPAFIEAFSIQIGKYKPETFDHVIFTFHGLPTRQVTKIHPVEPGTTCNCNVKMQDHGVFCYRATCYETARLLIKSLDIPTEKTTVTFQSRLSKNWLTPFTDDTIVELAKKGVKRILVTAPSFVADCLETIVEIEHDYNTLFKSAGGQEVTLVPSLNDETAWVEAIAKIINT